jgi:hypothetical protein
MPEEDTSASPSSPPVLEHLPQPGVVVEPLNTSPTLLDFIDSYHYLLVDMIIDAELLGYFITGLLNTPLLVMCELENDEAELNQAGGGRQLPSPK